jgi:hypothetical protein
MSDRISALEAELALARSEEAFLTAKAANAAGQLSNEEYQTTKLALRALRSDYRLNYREPSDGVVVHPAAITGTANLG